MVSWKRPPDTTSIRAAMGLVSFAGITQGVAPLVAHGVFDRSGRLALTLRLGAPWWWIASTAVVVVALVVLAVLDRARERTAPVEAGEGDSQLLTVTDEASRASPPDGYDAVSGLVLLVGVYNGVAPFVARLVFDGNLLLALPLRLSAPWWWISSLVVIVVSVVLLALIDAAKERRRGGPS